MNLLDQHGLERSAIVANCRMNRERGLVGSNGYDRELGLDPMGFLRERVGAGGRAAWLDLCCGSGRALIEAIQIAHDEALGPQISIVGVDLVGMFHKTEHNPNNLRLVEASLSEWRPSGRFDLITCVHGLHYIGDKLGLIARACSWLAEDGLFVANLSLANVVVRPSRHRPSLQTELRRAGLEYDRRQRRVAHRGRGEIGLGFHYLGADDQAGPNYTGQPAVNSHYKIVNSEGQPR